MLRNLSLTILLAFLLSTAFAGPIISDDQVNELIGDENRTSMQKSTSMVSRNQFGLEGENAATCYDSRIAGFINTGLSYYSHNMGQLANYILNQIKVARYGGYWLVHAEMIGGQRQGVQWQSAATGDIFAPSSRHGCYYHDSQTYIIIIQY